MAKNERILAIDIGSTGLRIAEFQYPASGGVAMLGFDHVEYSEHINESNRIFVISMALESALERGNYGTNKAAVCVSGQAAFMRFVKLPPVSEEESRIKQIVEYEARQNVPFPIEEVIWDFQLITGDDEDLEVMFVVIKNEIVEGVIKAVQNCNLSPILVDFAPAALYNVARANHVGDNECAMILNIGGRCSSLLFIEGMRFFVRTIPIAGFTITQQVAKEFGISTEEAEILKRRHGFVALGGAYEEPESEVAATISKIVRNVMTRLHGEINRSINVYRTQQKGSKPTHLFLSGGSSTMAFTNEFFQEKLRMEVNYLNPFKIVSLTEGLDIRQLQEMAHMFPEIVGVGLRYSVECPVEVSLVPESLRSKQAFSRRRPFIIAAGFAWLAILGVFIMVNMKKKELYSETYEDRKSMVERLDKITKDIQRADSARKVGVDNYQLVESLLDHRTAWQELYTELQMAKPQDVWFDSIIPLNDPIQGGEEEGEAPEPEKSMFVPPSGGEDTDQGVSIMPTVDAFVYFDISGRAVAIPGRKFFNADQLEYFHEQFQAAAPAEGDEPGGAPAEGEGGAAPAFWGPKSVDDPSNFSGMDASKLPEVLLESLRNSPMFAAEGTSIVKGNLDPVYRNVTKFQIQLKVRKPIPARW
jgi:type IV pilus assembly protein PilM